ncbi:isoleucine--tRNA ligase [Novosphingobium sp.]|uniref:isoleucine--tRNA ligase n=1 Tax=Novosphingobium sp. TaxID=1874826 RepID=UPI00286E6A56|nr:isoleucine--tRNA ligase [Novosphingobium sp.]
MTDKRDFRDTVFLPKTDFPMKAGLPQKEPGILSRWQDEGIYQQLREAREGREKFILHDGPPYANGDMHIGHALNHILKDMVVRTQSLAGKDAPYVPGWDCHGLPIEWKVEEQYRKKKLNKDEVPAAEFRAECRAYAQHWVDTQREQLKRLGINGDWDNPYLTMDFQAEATIVSELMKFAESGQLYRGAKPVMWSPVEKTALAEAEVEYEDIVSTQIDVAFQIDESPIEELGGAFAVIWTTTPWTIPVNQAIAYGPEIEYVLGMPAFVNVSDEAMQCIVTSPTFNEFFVRPVLIASELVSSFVARVNGMLKQLELGQYGSPDAKFELVVESRIKGSDLAGTIARHPMHALGGFFAKPRPFLPGDFVTTESGTGLVHMAPDHGEDDFLLCKANGIEPVFAVEGDGKYREDWAWLGGEGSVINPKFNAPDGPICTALREAGGLLAASADYKHSYPHSWRSKAKVIFRCTPQWFVPMDKKVDRQAALCATEAGIRAEQGEGETLRDLALKAITDTRWVPAKGENRIRSMVEGRPDWVLSRQRAWGVPITLFVNRKTGQYLCDPAVNARIIAGVREAGVDAWTEERAQEYLGADYIADDFERVTDILDVWFDSGCTHSFVLESGRWPGMQWPADLYLEGSDQHRGWFQSSLLQSCGTRGRAPYNAVLTHGFTMDAKGMKMSKSLGNTISPLKVMETNGADIIRLWALSVDYTEDHRIGDEILKGVADQYRKLRNTFRYLLGALDEFSEAEKVGVEAMPELERYVLALLAKLDATLKQAVADFDFNTYVRALTDFCNEDLSAFFFDIRKDSLYCDAATDPKRMAYRTVLDMLFHALVRYAAPVLVFTSEEVWGTRFPDAGSVHLLEWPEVDANWDNDALLQTWRLIRSVREQAFNVLEPMRRSKEIGSSLIADLRIEPAKSENFDVLKNVDLAEVLLCASVTVSKPTNGFTVISTNPDDPETPYSYGGSLIAGFISNHHKCGRCWRHLPDVAEDGDLCSRCDNVVAGMDAA